MAAGPHGLLLLDKPPGFSSTQALARAKRFLAARKAGHTGTLDPFATGLLPLAFGEATKFARFLSDAPKTYHATLRLGQVSTTGDTEGLVSSSGKIDADDSKIDEVLASFVGFQDQIPPMHSAVHVDGRRLYELARDGVEVERAPRRIEIVALHRLRFDGEALEIAVTCSKGTYVRTLAAEIGQALGCGAYLAALRRTAVAGFRVADAIGLGQLEAAGIAGARERLLPVAVMVAALPRRDLGPGEALRFTQGQRIPQEGVLPGSEWALFAPGGALLGVALCEAPGWLAPLRLMATGETAQVP